MIEFDSVTFSYPEGMTLFKNLSIEFPQGRFFLIKGHSGAGKSSLLKLMNRLVDPQAGEIRFKGRPLSSYAPQQLRTSILYIQQTPIVVTGSVKDNLLLPFAYKSNRDSAKPNGSQLMAYMDEFRLNNIALGDNAQNLSVGQLQRICFIRGLLLAPEIILLDEPTSALDEESSRIVESSLVKLCRESGRTVIMVSHKKFEPDTITPVALELVDGQIRIVE